MKFWERSKTMWKHSPRWLMFPQHFSFSQASTLVSITRQKHGTCFLLRKYNLIFQFLHCRFLHFPGISHLPGFIATAGWQVAPSGCWDWKCKTTVRGNTGEDCCFCSQETQNNPISGTKCSLHEIYMKLPLFSLC